MIDVSRQKATFNVKDKGQFDLGQLGQAVKQQNFRGCELLSGPEIPKT